MENTNGHKMIDLEKALQDALTAKAKLKKELRKIEQEIETYRHTRQLVASRLATDPVLKSRLQGMSRPEACAILMREMGGKAAIGDLIPKLYAAGLLPVDSGPEAWGKTRSALEQRLDLFIKTASGCYALVESVGEEFPTEEISNGRPPKGIKDSIFAVLEQEGKPLHYLLILRKLYDQGVKVDGEDPKHTLRAHLSQDSRFKNVRRGVWGLSIWG